MKDVKIWNKIISNVNIISKINLKILKIYSNFLKINFKKKQMKLINFKKKILN